MSSETATPQEQTPDGIRALEFFSGLGGLHYGLEFAVPDASVVAAFDINEHANKCYLHNFGLKPIYTGIEYLDHKAIDKFRANCWLMSPPCQPYTRGGKELDDKDARAEGLLHLVKLLGQVTNVPRYIFVENVPNFETSRSRELLVEKLDELNYEIHEFLVSPLQVGVPNDRKRYYLTARLRPEGVRDPCDPSYLDSATVHSVPWLSPPSTPFPQPRPIADYLEDPAAGDQTYDVPEKFITKRHKFRFDVVKPDSTSSSCFTKAYGSHHVIGSGSFLQTRNFHVDDQSALLTLGLRFFSPTEVARLHAFPITGEAELHNRDGSPRASRHAFAFPDSISMAQRWRLLGNSLNCRVVGVLMRDVLFRHT
ncbi:S-adenosyl-L-methionine-dependent methyltransferase [Powellomyces hirtus]|nr:S-adenosyl-L-methionine-dependent methyltransferase [Powellomyces hirtus]